MNSGSTLTAAAGVPQVEASTSRDANSTLPQKLDSLAITEQANTRQTPTAAPQEAVSKVEVPHEAGKIAPEVEVAPEDARQAYNQFLDRAVGTLPDVDTFGDLDNDVHPLFLRENIYQQSADPDAKFSPEPISPTVYTLILPALRLASLLITERSMCPVFDHIANGIVTRDAEGNTYIATGSLEGTKLGYDYVQAVFRYLTSRTRFLFISDDDKFGDYALATSGHRFDPVDSKGRQGSSFGRALQTVQIEDQDEQNVTCHVCMGSTQIRFRRYFLEYFENDMQLDSRHGRINALFQFAVTIMHEMAHTFGFYAENITRRLPQHNEPRWSFDVPLQEYGCAWEAWFSHGSSIGDIATIERAKMKPNSTLFPPDMLVRSSRHTPLDEPPLPYFFVSKPQHYLRAMTIRLWFCKSTWQAVHHGKDIQSDIWSQVKECRLSTLKDSAFMHALVNK